MNILYADSSLKEACVVIPNIIGAEHSLILPYPDAPTVNMGEYRAVLYAMTNAHHFGLKEIKILTDSQLVVGHVVKDWKCKHEHLRKLRDEIRKEMKTFDQCELVWISRELNPAGKVLEKRCYMPVKQK